MVHEAAAHGYQQRSETYVSARPGYHPVVLDAVVAALGSGRCLDLGAGTGIATQALVGRGVEVVAVEPVAAMRARLSEALPHVEAFDGRSEAIPLAAESVSSVLCAQTFHWFDHGPTLDEIVRVSATPATLVTLWNVRDESVPWMAAYTRVIDRYASDTPRYRTMNWRTAIEADVRFELVDEIREPNPQTSNPDHVVARALSTSFIASLDAAEQATVEADVRTIVDSREPVFDFPYETEAQIWRIGG
jgi:SAM-dependent methyltransferase